MHSFAFINKIVDGHTPHTFALMHRIVAYNLDDNQDNNNT